MDKSSGSIFNKQAAEKLRSPDDLDKYVQVINPSVWMVLLSCLLFVLALLAWGILGTVSTNITATGAILDAELADDGEVTCFISDKDVSSVDIGDEARVEGELMSVIAIEENPLSAVEAKRLIKSDYLASTLVKSDWVYRVTLAGDTSEISPEKAIPVKITVERVAPISLILRNRE